MQPDQNVFIAFLGASSGCTQASGTCQAGEAIRFSAGSFEYPFSCAAHQFSWNFGDEQYATGQNATHVYAAPGAYNITLTISNGTQTVALFDAMTVASTQNVTFDFSIATIPGVPNGYTFAATSVPANAITQWNWDFGDGILCLSCAHMQSHVYADSKQKTVVLTAVGFPGVVSHTIDVVRRRAVAPPVPMVVAVSAASGANVVLDAGRITVQIPPGALTRDQNVSMSTGDIPAEPANRAFQSVGPALDLQFEDSAPLSAPLSVAFDLNGTTADAHNLQAVAYVSDAGCPQGCFIGAAMTLDATTNRATVTLSPAVVNAAELGRAIHPDAILTGPQLAIGFISVNDAVENALGCSSYTNGRWAGKLWNNQEHGFVDLATSDTFSAHCPLIQAAPGKRTLVLVHGMGSSVEEAFGCGPESVLPPFATLYDQVIGFDYDWTQGLEQSGAQLAQFLNCLGLQNIDIEAHSEGVLVALAAAGLSDPNMTVQNMILLGGPINGTPAAELPETLFTALLAMPDNLCLLHRSIEDIQSGHWRMDLMPNSDALTRIKERLSQRVLQPHLWTVAGDKPFPGEAMLFPDPNDGLTPVDSAWGYNSGLRTTPLGPFPVDHIHLQCDPTINDVLARTLPPPAPVVAPTIVSFAAVPSSIATGSTSTLTWATTNATSTMISGLGAEPVNGSVGVTPAVTTTYTLTATGPGGSASKSVMVTVLPPTPAPTIISFTAAPSNVTQGESSTLAWVTINSTSATISGLGNEPVNGSASVSPASTTTYTLTVSGPGGTSSATATVTVTAPQPPAPAPTPSGAFDISIQGIGTMALSGTDVYPTETYQMSVNITIHVTQWAPLGSIFEGTDRVFLTADNIARNASITGTITGTYTCIENSGYGLVVGCRDLAPTTTLTFNGDPLYAVFDPATGRAMIAGDPYQDPSWVGVWLSGGDLQTVDSIMIGHHNSDPTQPDWAYEYTRIGTYALWEWSFGGQTILQSPSNYTVTVTAQH